MAISFMLLVPVGALLSRYYKAVFINAWFKVREKGGVDDNMGSGKPMCMLAPRLGVH